MKIYLKRMIEETTEIEIEEDDKVRFLKYKLCDKKGIPMCLQALEFNGTKLEDDMSLSTLGISDGDSIRVLQGSGCDEGGCIQIHAKTLNGKKIPLGAHTHDMGYDLGRQIAMKIGISVIKIHVLFNGKLLEGESLAEYGIGDQSVVEVIDRKEINIVVKTLDGKEIPHTMEEYDTVERLKGHLFHKLGNIPPSLQILIFNDKLLKNDNYLKEYNLSDQSVIWFMKQPTCDECSKISISVHLPDTNTTKKLDVNPCDSVYTVLYTALDLMEFELVQCHPYLEFNGENLPHLKSLSEVGVTDGDSLAILLDRSLHIFVKDRKGRNRTYKVMPTHPIADFRVELVHILGVPACKILLHCCGKDLYDGRTFADYKIKNESTCHVSLRY